VNSELNKVFGRDFIIGFFLPALFFSMATFFLAKVVWPDALWLQINWRKPFEDAGLFAVCVWVFAVFLQSVNREIFRTAEGYWRRGLRGRFKRSHCEKFRKLKAKFDGLYNKSGALSDEQEQELSELSRRLAREYPSKKSLILPTSFGNAVRAYEDYSRVIYGFESINGWSRLQGLMSKDFREILANDRARVDLWLNMCVLAPFFALELAVVSTIKECSLAVLLLPLLAFTCLAYVRSRSSAQQFGEQVKAAFDIYLPELAARLGFVLSSDTAKNRKFWEAFSQVMVHRDAGALKEMMAAGLERVSASTKETGSAETSAAANDD
jgi:hypothetical protein